MKVSALRRAFTLVEVLVCLVILGVLAGLVTAQYGDYKDLAKDAKAQAIIAQSCREKILACTSHGRNECPMFDDCVELGQYDTTQVGDQTWFGSNINRGVMIIADDILANGSQKWCYENDTRNCELYGGLYTWDAAENICPNGFRLPTQVEVLTLYANSGTNNDEMVNNLLQVGQAAGATNSTGFQSMLGGMRTASGYYLNQGRYFSFWTQDDIIDIYGRFGQISVFGETGHAGASITNKDSGLSVRCLKN